MKHICKYCHFLAKEMREEESDRVHSSPLSAKEREEIETIKDYWSLKCWMGVWDEGIASHHKNRTETICRIHRKSDCFFWPHHPHMLFQAAQELQKRGREHELLKRSNLYTRIGLWIAAIGLLFGAVVRLLIPSP